MKWWIIISVILYVLGIINVLESSKFRKFIFWEIKLVALILWPLIMLFRIAHTAYRFILGMMFG